MEKSSSRAAKHHGSEGRRSLKIVPRKCLTRLLKPIENDAFGSFFLLLLPWILATFTSGPQIGKHHGKKQLPAAKHHGSEGRRSPQNCTPKMPNVTSETHRKWCFWLLFPLAAAMNFSYLYIRSPNRKTPWKKAAPGSKTPWLWRTEKPQNCTPKMPNATSETHRKWCFWLLFPLCCCHEF